MISTTIIILAFGAFSWLIRDSYIVLKNDATTLGFLYEKEAIDFDDRYAPLVEQLRIFTATDKDGNPLNIIRHGSHFDGGYAVATQAFDESDVLLGYGIADDITFEEQFSDIYHKRSFGFDCGITHIAIKNELCHFIPQCIAADTTIYQHQDSTGVVLSYSDQIESLGLEDKKVFLKMDIEGAEYEAFDDILKYHSDNITGIALEIHIFNQEHLEKAIQLLKNINEKFLLIHAHAIKAPFIKMKKTSNLYGCISTQIELSFVNKNLAKEYQVAQSQKHPNKLDYPNFENTGELYWEIK